MAIGLKILYADEPTTPSSSVPKLTERMAATVTNCRDGDTCRIKTTSGQMWMNIRLAGIDAPEIASKRKKATGQPFGEKAKVFVNQNLAGQNVDLEQVDLDSYNRPVVVVWKAQKNVNLAIVEEGLAEAYRGPVKRIDREEYIAAETRAKNAKKGIWVIPKGSYVSPGEFRKSLRKK